MSQFPGQYQGASQREQLDYASGTESLTVAQFFNTVYAWMCVGLALSACVGWWVSQQDQLMQAIYGTKGGYLAIGLGAFGIAWFVQSQAGKLTATVATILFLVYAAVIGALLAGIFIIYSPKTLMAAFFLTAGTFGGMSIYGFVTKRDLSRIGSMAVMLAFGFIIASVVNIWLGSDLLGWVITYAILVLFVIITAYETQQLKQIAIQFADHPEMAARYAIVGSLVLYIAFINLFIAILRILGGRRD
ncbi:MAG: Bax inhibitor-1/YccA family protein [Tepidisphaeraceae bacterium]